MSSREAILEELKQIKHVGVAGAAKLYAAGYTVYRLSYAAPEKIEELLGVSRKKAEEIISSAKAKLIEEAKELPGPGTAATYEEFLEKRIKWYSTGSKQMDELIGGGLRSSSTIGVSGPQAVGKTQLALTASIDCICRHKEYVLFIETELDTLDPRRLREIAKTRGVIDEYDPEKFILVDAYKIKDVATQFYYYEVLREQAISNNWNVGLIILDSFTATFQRKFGGREQFVDRKAELKRHLSFLEDMAKDFNAAVLLTCQVMEVPVSPQESRGALDSALVRSMFGTNWMPWGGHILRHTLGTWISLEKTRVKDLWKAHLFDSSRVKSGECYFQITEAGITDVSADLLKRLKGTASEE